MGPIEELVAQFVADVVGADAAKVLDSVETTRARLGDVVVDLTQLPQCEEPGASDVVAAALRHRREVTGVLPVPPRVYVTLADDVVTDAVAAAVAARGHRYGNSTALAGRTVAVASADPNLNKALHVGHLRNAVLGAVVANLFEAAGATVRRTCMESDWGPHIAEAAVGYLLWGDGATPESAAQRPGEFVGGFYARYHEVRRTDPAAVESAHADFVARMVDGDADAAAVVDAVTGWAAEGIHALYARVRVRFDEVHRERAMLGDSGDVVVKALAAGVLSRRDDGSVCADLAAYGLPEVTLVRANGLPVSYTQWLGVDHLRYGRGELDQIVQVDGAEWQAGNLVYDAILDLLDAPWRHRREIAFYGMVNGAKGRKMGSRTGEATTADALLDSARDRLTSLLAAEDGTPLPPGLAEEAAVALVTYGLLRRRRIDPLAFDDAELFARALPELTALLRAYGGAGCAGEDSVARRRLALELNETPRVLSRALAERDSTPVLRHLGYVARHASTGGGSLRAAVATVVAKGLAVLNVHVTPELAARPLPPEPLLRRRTARAVQRG